VFADQGLSSPGATAVADMTTSGQVDDDNVDRKADWMNRPTIARRAWQTDGPAPTFHAAQHRPGLLRPLDGVQE
jgi:hypothetical protein